MFKPIFLLHGSAFTIIRRGVEWTGRRPDGLTIAQALKCILGHSYSPESAFGWLKLDICILEFNSGQLYKYTLDNSRRHCHRQQNVSVVAPPNSQTIEICHLLETSKFLIWRPDRKLPNWLLGDQNLFLAKCLINPVQVDLSTWYCFPHDYNWMFNHLGNTNYVIFNWKI